MSWCEQISQIESDFSEHKMLLSSALLNTAAAVRGVAADSVLVWLNREITGYKTEELNAVMKNKLQASLLAPRTVSGVWGNKLANGIFVEKGAKDIIVGTGIVDVEETMNKLFDLSVFEKGNPELMLATVSRSATNIARIHIPSAQEGITYAFEANKLIEIYTKIGNLLSEVIASLKHYYTGKELVRLNYFQVPEANIDFSGQIAHSTQISIR